MSWNLQQINNANSQGPTVPGEYVACPQAPASNAGASEANTLFVCTFGDQQHFAYLAGINNIQDCWYDDASGWHLQQINNVNGQGPTVPGEYIACPQATASLPTTASNLFVCAFGDQQHFAYLDGNGNIQDCWYDDASGWHLQQINNVNGQGPTVPGEYIACPQATSPVYSGEFLNLFVCVFGDQQHFAYLDGNGNIQDCWYDDASGWHLQQINNANGQGPTVPGEYVACPQATAAFPVEEFTTLSVCTFRDQQHFAYVDANGNIQDCWYDGVTNQWHLQQINNAGVQGPTVPGEYVACPQAGAAVYIGPFVCVFGDQQHFAYLDGNGNIQDCWYDGVTNQWHLQQINNANGQGPTVPGEYVACPQATVQAGGYPPGLFVCAFGDQQHFAYVDYNGNIQDCWYDDASGWHLQRINNAPAEPFHTEPAESVACPQATVGADIEGSNLFVCVFGNQQHFAFLDGNGNIQDCWYG